MFIAMRSFMEEVESVVRISAERNIEIDNIITEKIKDWKMHVTTGCLTQI